MEAWSIGLRIPKRAEPKDLEDTYTFVKEIPADYKCLICSKLLREPQVTECCGHHYCLHCLEQWLRGNHDKTCPVCRTQPCNYMRYLPMKREIDQLEVYCPYKELGCTVVSALKDAEEHRKVCDYEEVACSCGQKLLRKELTNHKQKSCPNRQVRCTHCGKTGPFHQLQLHHQVCPDIPLNCPNGCDASGIKRKNLDKHKKVCPMMPVECPFSKGGCQKTVLRRDLKSHQASNVQEHLLLVMNAFSELSAQHSALRKAHETLQREHTQLKEKVSQQTKKPVNQNTHSRGWAGARRSGMHSYSRDEGYARSQGGYYSQNDALYYDDDEKW